MIINAFFKDSECKAAFTNNRNKSIFKIGFSSEQGMSNIYLLHIEADRNFVFALMRSKVALELRTAKRWYTGTRLSSIRRK